MFKNIIKRDGRIVPFDPEKITVAISKAGKATGEFDYDTAKRLTIKVLLLAEELIRDRDPHVEEIQDIVEEILLSSPYRKTAKAYIIYRDQHARMREIARQGGLELIDNYLSKVDWRISENSNMSFSLQGLNNYISSEISKSYWLHKIYPPEVREAHINGDMHIHDLNALSAYCVGWDLMDLLIRGFGGVPGKVESRPAKHLRPALGQIVNFLYTTQGETAGAQAFSNVDTLLAPFIAYDGLNYKQVKQALQEWVFNLNVPTRVGFQTPFSNITLDLKVPEHFASQAVIIGGKPQDATYGDFQKEMDMFNQALFEVLSEGDAKGRVFTFPIPTINITKDFEWNSPVVDLIMQATAKYGIPYFANYINSDLRPEDARSMCCRLRLETKELKHRGGGLFGSNPLTGSIGVVTISLPRIGYLSNSEEEFFDKLLWLMEIAKTSLEIKRKVLERFTEAGLYPYSRHYLSSVKEKTGAYWANHFSTIGIIGMNEAIANARWLKSKGIWTEEGKAFALKVMDFMRERLIDFQKETGNLYNLEATPAEGTSYRLAKIDKQKYPDIITQGSEHPYYTNSSWLPVGFTESIKYILDHQDELQSKYTGGTVQHLFLGQNPNPEKLKAFIEQVFKQYKLPYISITPTFSICSECGYVEGEHSQCPKCGSSCEIYSRVVGYLRPVMNWNDGKKEEFKERQYLEFKV
ncbi:MULTISPECIES: ribonucleoside triphosphate reductase [Thermodesulfovibrio]|jgi:ribonucleoside-triphosphate reductase|uniref:ribonucleoside triphosphate reductase n=1 Tax=Thermodesulfovibrio TaxID=28261 RepID=UPI002609A1B1|nr:ribonucleoside triphosphate reductase [Thermodesulfovibrio sp.]